MVGNVVTQRPLIELRTLYERQPSIRDVIVEGRDDAGLVHWYLTEHDLRAVVMAVDDRANVPSDLVLRSGGEVGPRGRVIGFAHQVDEWTLTHPTATCIIDLDRDCLLDTPPVRAKCLLTTDYGTMDVYMLQTRPFNQFLRVVLGRADDAEALREKLLPALNELCVVRSVLHWSGLGIKLIRDYAACCEFTEDSSSLDTEELLDRTLKGDDREHRNDLLAEIGRVRLRMPANRMLAVRGHDVGALVIRALALKNVWAREDAFERAWRGCLQAPDLDDFALFQQLLARIGP